VKTRGVADALKDNRFGIVEEPLARDPAEGLGRAHKRAAKGIHRQIEDKLAPQGAGVAEYDDKEPEGA